jgi:hypothetical protein
MLPIPLSSTFYKLISVISGGEKSRSGLAAVPPVLKKKGRSGAYL